MCCAEHSHRLRRSVSSSVAGASEAVSAQLVLRRGLEDHWVPWSLILGSVYTRGFKVSEEADMPGLTYLLFPSALSGYLSLVVLLSLLPAAAKFSLFEL